MSTSTSNTPGLNRNYGHSLPPGSSVVEMKYCEICGMPFARPFAPTEPVVQEECDSEFYVWRGRHKISSSAYTVVRRRDHGQRFCRRCVGNSLQPDPVSIAQYKAQLPNEREARHDRVYLTPRYDDSLAAISTASTTQRRYKPTIQWTASIRQAMSTSGPMSWEDIADLVPGATTPSRANARCRLAGLKFTRVGDAPRRVAKGPTPGLFIISDMVDHYRQSQSQLARGQVQ